MQGSDPRARRPAVSRGHTRRCRSGSTDIRLHRKAQSAGGWDLVRCDVPLTSYRGPRTVSSIRLVRPRCFLLASAALTSFAVADLPAALARRGPRAAAAGRGVPRPIPQTGKAGGPGRAEPARAASRRPAAASAAAKPVVPTAAAQAPLNTNVVAESASRLGLTVQRDTRDRRSHLGPEPCTSRGYPHRVGGCAGRGRRHLRRQPGRALGFLHAWLHQQPDQHALQRHQDRSSEQRPRGSWIPPTSRPWKS